MVLNLGLHGTFYGLHLLPPGNIHRYLTFFLPIPRIILLQRVNISTIKTLINEILLRTLTFGDLKNGYLPLGPSQNVHELYLGRQFEQKINLSTVFVNSGSC